MPEQDKTAGELLAWAKYPYTYPQSSADMPYTGNRVYTAQEYRLLQDRNVALSERVAELTEQNRKLRDDLLQLTGAVTDEIAKRLSAPVHGAFERNVITPSSLDDPNNNVDYD